MSTLTLHYFYDPYCGWCYGAAPLIDTAASILPVRLHAGGMLTGPDRKPLDPAMRSHIESSDQRIEELTGQPFSSLYRSRLLQQPDTVYQSEAPTTAILAAESLSGEALPMLHTLQHLHYVEGERINEMAILLKAAENLNLDPQLFHIQYEALEGTPCMAHIDASRALLHQLGGRGFPTLVFEIEGRYQRIDHSRFLGNTDEWADVLHHLQDATRNA
ncbi:MAG: DsbA family protein [Pigmentiphaga sp.]|nr:DsbA family protein [Pigmentiphaga sp.]